MMVQHQGEDTVTRTDRPNLRAGPANRRESHGRRDDDEDVVGNDDLRMALQQLAAELRRAIDVLEKRQDKTDGRLDKLTSRVLVSVGAGMLFVFLLTWIGPTRIMTLAKLLMGGGP